MNIWQGLADTIDRWKARRAEKARARHELRQWFLLAGFSDEKDIVSPRPERLNAIYPPSDRFWADPFACRRGGRNFVFLEEYPYLARRGHISVLELDDRARPVGETRPVIQESCHLSYPCLFEFAGDLYMIPEKKAQRRVDLYRCVAFPDRWEIVRTWFSGIRMVDCTVFEHEGCWWLFCAVKRDGLRYDETLMAYHTDNPLTGDWAPHPLNPLVRDFGRGRPAGRVQRLADGRLLRPSQDCLRHYGDGLNINAIELLTTDEYREQRLWHKTGEEAGGWAGLHHLDWHQGLLVMDALRILPE
jgi:hypothetical protein